MSTNKQMQKLEESYHQVTAFYDLADSLIASVLNSPKEQQEAHYQLVSPLVDQLEQSADILTEEFINIAEGKDTGSAAAQRGRIEGAFRKAYAAMDDYNKRATASRQQALLKKMSDSVQPVIDGIKQHIEKVIGIFIGFIDLALDRVMQKNDLEQLRKRDAKIAAMMHNMAMQGKTT
jgi:hypothetical protein